MLGVVALAASVLRFGFEIRQIRTRCCDDFPIFWETVGAAQQGGPLYRTDSMSDYHPGAPIYKFPPFYATILLVTARAGIGAHAVAAHFWAEIAMYLLAVALLARCVAGAVTGWTALPFWVAALNHGPFFETLSGLQVEVPILLCTTVTVAAIERRRECCAGGALGLAASLKLYPALLVAFFIARRHWRAVIGFGALSLASIAVGGAAFGLDDSRSYFGTILPHMLAETPAEDYGTENLSIASYLADVRGGHWALARLDPEAAKAVGALAAGLLAVLSAWAVRRRGPNDALSWPGVALFVPVLLLWLPNSWTNYQLLLLLPIAVALLSPVAPAGARVSACCACLLVTYHQNIHVDWPGHLVPLWPSVYAAWQTARILATLLCWAAMLWMALTCHHDGVEVRPSQPPRPALWPKES